MDLNFLMQSFCFRFFLFLSINRSEDACELNCCKNEFIIVHVFTIGIFRLNYFVHYSTTILYYSTMQCIHAPVVVSHASMCHITTHSRRERVNKPLGRDEGMTQLKCSIIFPSKNYNNLTKVRFVPRFNRILFRLELEYLWDLHHSTPHYWHD